MAEREIFPPFCILFTNKTYDCDVYPVPDSGIFSQENNEERFWSYSPEFMRY